MTFKALVVEDEAALRFIYERMLTSLGWEVQMAKDGRQALAILEQYTPDLVFLDMLLPLVNGLQVLQQIAADSRFGQTCIVIASSSKEYARHTHLMPCCEFLLKPIYPSQVKEIAERIMQHPSR